MWLYPQSRPRTSQVVSDLAVIKPRLLYLSRNHDRDGVATHALMDKSVDDSELLHGRFTSFSEEQA